MAPKNILHYFPPHISSLPVMSGGPELGLRGGRGRCLGERLEPGVEAGVDGWVSWDSNGRNWQFRPPLKKNVATPVNGPVVLCPVHSFLQGLKGKEICNFLAERKEKKRRWIEKKMGRTKRPKIIWPEEKKKKKRSFKHLLLPTQFLLCSLSGDRTSINFLPLLGQGGTFLGETN